MIKTFEDQLDKLRTRIIKMGSLVDEQVEYAFRSLVEWDTAMARLVMDRDSKVDKLDFKIEKQCQRIFALQQPVARDLRLIMAALKINSDLERMGDLAFNVARAVAVSATRRNQSALPARLLRMNGSRYRVGRRSTRSRSSTIPSILQWKAGCRMPPGWWNWTKACAW